MKMKLLLVALFAMFSFQLFAQATAYPVPDINQCNSEIFDLTVQTPITLGNQSPDDFTVTYFLSWADAENNTNPLANPGQFIITTGNIEQALYIRVSGNADDSFDVTSFVVGFWGGPVVPQMEDITVCESFTLPPLETGNYYTGPNGTGTILMPGTVITQSSYLYVYASNGECSSQTEFYIGVNTTGNTMADPLIACDPSGMGTAVFDLEPMIGWAWQSYPGAMNVNIYMTMQDALEGINPITNINTFTNVDPGQQIVYLGIQTETCNWVVMVPLIVTECTDNTLSGHVAYDADGNGCDENDAPAAGVLVYYYIANQGYYAYTDSEGNYTFYNVPNGNVTVYVNTFYPTNFVSMPDNYTVFMEGSADNINFCLTPPAPVNDVAVSLYPLNGAQPGFTASYVLVINNYGNTVANGTATVQFNDTQLDYVNSWPSMTQSGNTLTINYSNLAPYDYRLVYIDFQVAMPGIVDLGDIISFNSNVTFDGGTDANMSNNTYVLDQVSVNSWDPNDINVREGEQITLEQAGDYLHYIIRFQNTGTINAHNVKILTTLDSNLDWNTFEPMVSGHDFQANRTDGQVEFRFDNIELPGSQMNEADSHGYIIYRIKPKSTVAEGDVISGLAGIYFDFNEPMVTNTVTTTIMSAAGVNDISADGFVMYPNPASSKVTLHMRGTANNIAVTITDVLGKTVAKTTFSGTQSDLDVSSLKRGVYFVTLNADGKQATKKLVVE